MHFPLHINWPMTSTTLTNTTKQPKLAAMNREWLDLSPGANDGRKIENKNESKNSGQVGQRDAALYGAPLVVERHHPALTPAPART